MIAHSGFSRGFGRSRPALPGSFQEWITENGDKPLSAFEMSPDYSQSSAPAPAAPASGLMTQEEHLAVKGLHFGHSMGAAMAILGADVPMAMHLDHLQITAKAERSFGFKLGFFAGMLLTLIGTYLHYRRQ